jgi:antitoxin ParD1/3/4
MPLLRRLSRPANTRTRAKRFAIALRVLQQRRKEDGLRLKALRAQIKVGIDAIDRGDFMEVDDADLEEYLERLTLPAVKRVR